MSVPARYERWSPRGRVHRGCLTADAVRLVLDDIRFDVEFAAAHAVPASRAAS